MAKRELRTQRAWASYESDALDIMGYDAVAFAVSDCISDTPVIVVPEAAVRGCHKATVVTHDGTWCENCGSRWLLGSGWQRPAILRVAKEKKQ